MFQLIDGLKGVVENHEGLILTDTPAIDLITENGAVTGVIAQPRGQDSFNILPARPRAGSERSGDQYGFQHHEPEQLYLSVLGQRRFHEVLHVVLQGCMCYNGAGGGFYAAGIPAGTPCAGA